MMQLNQNKSDDIRDTNKKWFHLSQTKHGMLYIMTY